MSKKTASVLALQIAVVYAIAGTLWITLSDRALGSWLHDTDVLTTLQMYKGWMYVALSGILIYFTTKHFIAKQTQALSALDIRQRVYENLLENAPVGLCEIDLSAFAPSAQLDTQMGRKIPILTVNKAIVNMLALESKAQARQLLPKQLEPYKDRIVESLNQTAHEPSSAFSIDARLTTTKSEQISVIIRAALVPGFEHNWNRILLSVGDVTEKIRVQNALRESRRSLTTLMGNLPGMVYSCENDPDWTMKFVSDGCCDLTGYDPSDLIDNHTVSFGSLIHPDDRDDVWSSIQKETEQGQPFRLTYRLIHRDGQIRWVLEHGSAVLTESGEIAKLEGFITDISARVRAEEELRKAERLKSVGQAAATIIHDFKNPMQVILATSEFLGENDLDPELRSRYAERIIAEIQRMHNMCQEILDFARGELTLYVAQIDLYQLCEGIVDSYKSPMDKSGITLTHEHTTQFRITAAVDKEKLRRVLMNLINNARDAIHGPGRVTVKSAVHPDSLRIEISDNGPGIPEEIQPTVFDPFVTSGKKDGTGLGLAIARNIIEAHRGTISFDSSPKHGTTFRIQIPQPNLEIIPTLKYAQPAEISH